MNVLLHYGVVVENTKLYDRLDGGDNVLLEVLLLVPGLQYFDGSAITVAQRKTAADEGKDRAKSAAAKARQRERDLAEGNEPEADEGDEEDKSSDEEEADEGDEEQVDEDEDEE